MNSRLKNKWVLITGASGGFGAAAARAFGAEGAKLLLGARRTENLKSVATAALKAGAARAEHHFLDVSKTTSVTEFIQWARTKTDCVDVLINNAGGSIINLGSTAGHVAYEGGAAYCAAKAGELQITRALRLELNGTGIRVSTVDPGLAKTDFSLVRFKGDAARAEKIYAGTNPLVAEDVAEILVWVASRPPHVNIDELIVKPVDQAAMHKIHRRKTDSA